MSVEPAHQALLLATARTAILERLVGAGSAQRAGGPWPAPLLAPGASFVTLTVGGRLRGCIGTLEPSRALVDDVWSNARRTAFEDPRFPPLGEAETPAAAVEISVLGPLQALQVESEAALIEALRPGVDGLLMTYGAQRATFLPKVWRTLPEPELFLRHLKRKMGLPDDFWHETVQLRRYGTEEFGGRLAA